MYTRRIYRVYRFVWYEILIYDNYVRATSYETTTGDCGRWRRDGILFFFIFVSTVRKQPNRAVENSVGMCVTRSRHQNFRGKYRRRRIVHPDDVTLYGGGGGGGDGYRIFRFEFVSYSLRGFRPKTFVRARRRLKIMKFMTRPPSPFPLVVPVISFRSKCKCV